MTTGNDCLLALIASRNGHLDIKLIAFPLLKADSDTVLTDKPFPFVQCLRRHVFQHFQLIVALADECSQRDGDGQSDHACAWYSHTHGILQDVGTQQGLYLLRATAQLFCCL